MPVNASFEGDPGVIVVFRNDDPSARSEVTHEARVAAVFERYGVCQTLGVIPCCALGSHHDSTGAGEVEIGGNDEMVAFLRGYAERSGSEIAMHGYSHRANRFSIRRRREFAELRGLGLAEQEDKIRRGTELLVEAFGIRPATFIPPWNRLDANTLEGCARVGYRVVSAGAYTPTWGDMVSIGSNADLTTFPSLLDRALRSPRLVILVVTYHSRTIQTPEEFALLQRSVALAAETRECRVVTLSQLAADHPDRVGVANEAARAIVCQDQVLGTVQARASYYLRVIERAGLPCEANRLLCLSEPLYLMGRYEEVCGLLPDILVSCRRIQRVVRTLAGCAGFVAGVAYGAAAGAGVPFLSSLGDLPPVAIAILAGWFVRWRATAPDVRREMDWLVSLGIINLILGLAIGEWGCHR